MCVFLGLCLRLRLLVHLPHLVHGGVTLHDDPNSLLTILKSTSYNLDTVVAPNSRKKGRQNCTIATWAAVLSVDLSPASTAGRYARSASTLHDWQQIASSRLVKRQGAGPGPGPGPRQGSVARCGMVGGVLGRAATSSKISRFVVMPPGRFQFAPQSLGWTRVCGTEKSGVWVLNIACLCTWTMFRSSVNAGHVVRRLALRQDMIVCAHTHVGTEQHCHKPSPPFSQRWFWIMVTFWSCMV